MHECSQRCRLILETVLLEAVYRFAKYDFILGRIPFGSTSMFTGYFTHRIESFASRILALHPSILVVYASAMGDYASDKTRTFFISGRANALLTGFKLGAQRVIFPSGAYSCCSQFALIFGHRMNIDASFPRASVKFAYCTPTITPTIINSGQDTVVLKAISLMNLSVYSVFTIRLNHFVIGRP